ncbi:hypothetical protein ACQR1W_31445 [Bradyrhizobium sp. HKCCYLS1011]|uniref:hypothetical protein n=1 Tax=Bradyrhizobium sp. HKCCYLS1011 TaxID=3420733 RepID=UPI003EBD4303
MTSHLEKVQADFDGAAIDRMTLARAMAHKASIQHDIMVKMGDASIDEAQALFVLGTVIATCETRLDLDNPARSARRP